MNKMMSTNIESSKMENSTILREIADLDITAPITVSISFEEDFDEAPIKTEIETDDCQEGNQVTTVSAFFPIPEPKLDIKAEPLAKEHNNELIAQNNFQDTSARQPDSLQEKLPAGDQSRKRKTENAELWESKKGKTISDPTNNEQIRRSLDTSSHIKTNNIQPGPTPNASEYATNSSVVNTNKSSLSDLGLSANGLQQTDVDKINTYITKCLTELSENMRHVILAYDAHRRQQITKEAFMKVKLHKFNLCYKTFITVIVPEANNTEFISTFLNNSVQLAIKKPCNRNGHQLYQDYANLLCEMVLWAKRKERHTQAASSNDVSQFSQPPTLVENNAAIGSKVNKNLTQEKRNDNFQISNTNAQADKVCIFSAGPPENALSINIDPILNKYLQIIQNPSTNLNEASANDPQSSNNTSTTPMFRTADDYFRKNVAKSKKPAQRLAQPTTSKAPNVVSSHLRQIPVSNYITPSQQTAAQTRSSQIQLENPMLVNHLMQPIPSLQPQQGYLQHQNYEPRSRQAMPPPPYDRSRLPQMHPGQQHPPPQYHSVSQPQPTPTQFQQPHYFQSHLGSLPQQQQLQPQFVQPQVPVIQYNQARQQVPHQSSTQSLQQGPQQYKQHPHSQAAEHWPSVTELLATPPPYPNNEQQLVGQWQSNCQEPQQLQPPSTSRSEWHQGLNSIYQAGQVNTLTQKGSPRSASTDSGFISPLNFNASTDQTMPTSPQDPETPMPMIVHVTSLSEKAAFVESGKCIVCKKTTKQMCMGCMKIYYCNYQCQSVDWATHAPYCKQDTN